MNRMELLRSLAPGFMPLIVFILADSIWGTRIGLLVAVLFGILELGFSWVKERVIDRFLLLDIGLILVLGLVSLWRNNDIFFKLKPALIELMFAALLGISAWSSHNIVWMMSRRYMRKLQVTEEMKQRMRRGMRPLCLMFFLHAALTAYAAFFMSRGAWAFISGGLFYLMFVGYLAYEILKKRMVRAGWRRKYADDEWFDLVDESGNVTGTAPRSVCHSTPGMLHPVVHLHVIDDKDRIFLQKRVKTKQIQPGKWDTAVGGHVHAGESVEEALKREALEELGMKSYNASLMATYRWDSEVESELVYLFITRYSGPFSLDTTEMADGKFWRIRQIREKLGRGVFTPNFELEFPLVAEHHQKILK